MNHISLIGRLTRDPELQYTSNGVAVGKFNIAIDRPTSKDGNKETDFINIVTWQKIAENCGNYLKKGRLVAISGRLQIRRYETKEGQKRQAAEVVASEVQFLERAKDQQEAVKEESSIPAGINLDDLPF